MTLPLVMAPSELIRDQILDGHPNWHDALRDSLETLEEAGVPKNATPDAATLRTIVEAREEGRRFIVDRQEHALQNRFPIQAPPRVRYYRFEGLQEQMNAWLAGCRLPHVHTGRLAGTFADPPSFLDASSFHQTMPTAYDTAFDDFVWAETSVPTRRRRSAATTWSICCGNISTSWPNGAAFCPSISPMASAAGSSLTTCFPRIRSLSILPMAAAFVEL